MSTNFVMSPSNFRILAMQRQNRDDHPRALCGIVYRGGALACSEAIFADVVPFARRQHFPPECLLTAGCRSGPESLKKQLRGRLERGARPWHDCFHEKRHILDGRAQASRGPKDASLERWDRIELPVVPFGEACRHTRGRVQERIGKSERPSSSAVNTFEMEPISNRVSSETLRSPARRSAP